jgi:hypothetical protein
MPEEPAFLQSVKEHVRPYIIHAVAVVIILATLVIADAALEFIGWLSPKHAADLAYAQEVDIWVIRALITLFGVTTVALIAISLLGHILQAGFRAWRNRHG